MQELKPLNGFVITEDIPEPETTVILNSQKPYRQLKVIKTCEGSLLPEGSVIYTSLKGGIPIPYQGNNYIWVQEKDIMGYENEATK